MLKFCIYQSDLHSNWKLKNEDFGASKSWIKPYRHSFLESFYSIQSDRFVLIIREVVSESGIESYDQPQKINIDFLTEKLNQTNKWLLDWIVIEIHLGKLTINTGSKGVAPVYLIEFEETLRGSWDPFDLYEFLPENPLNLERSIHYLSNFSQPFSSQTVFEKMVRITDRCEVHWNLTTRSTKLQLFYPDSDQLIKPRKIRKGANPVEALTRIIKNYLKIRIPDGHDIHSHLSGGFDSGIVTSLTSILFPKSVKSYSLIQPGLEGKEQQKRCMEFVNIFDLANKSYNIETIPVFKDSYSRMSVKRVIPWEDCYGEAFEQILMDISNSGGSILLMGTGGDELLYPHWEELDKLSKEEQKKWMFPDRQSLPKFLTDDSVETFYSSFLEIDRAPNSVISASALDDKAINAPQCLRYGIWPIHPLVNIDVVKFCRSLPKEWRENRYLFQQILNNLGCSSNITDPKDKESFSGIMKQSLTTFSKPIVEELFANSKLADANIINREVLLSEYKLFCNGMNGLKSSHFYATAILEMTLRSIDEQRTKRLI